MTTETKALERRQDRALTPVDKMVLGFMDNLSKREANLANLLPPGASVERFKEGVRFALAQNPDLLKCSPSSIMLACMKAAKLGVDVSGGALGHGYLVPYGEECTFVQGYKGLVALAIAAGTAKDLTPVLVYENDEFTPEEGDNPVFSHKPLVPRRLDQVRGAIIAAYTRVTLPDGTRVIKGYLDLHDIHRIESGVRGSKSPWRGPHRPEMVKKSTVRNAFKTLGVPESESGRRFQRAVEADIESESYDVEGEVVEQPKTGMEAIRAEMKKQQAAEAPALSAPGPSFSDLDARLSQAREKVPVAEGDYTPPEPTDEQLAQEQSNKKGRKST